MNSCTLRVNTLSNIYSSEFKLDGWQAGWGWSWHVCSVAAQLFSGSLSHSSLFWLHGSPWVSLWRGDWKQCTLGILEEQIPGIGPMKQTDITATQAAWHQLEIMFTHKGIILRCSEGAQHYFPALTCKDCHFKNIYCIGHVSSNNTLTFILEGYFLL